MGNETIQRDWSVAREEGVNKCGEWVSQQKAIVGDSQTLQKNWSIFVHLDCL